MAVTSDDKYVISSYNDGSINVFDFQTRQRVHQFEYVHEGKFGLREDIIYHYI